MFDKSTNKKILKSYSILINRALNREKENRGWFFVQKNTRLLRGREWHIEGKPNLVNRITSKQLLSNTRMDE